MIVPLSDSMANIIDTSKWGNQCIICVILAINVTFTVHPQIKSTEHGNIITACSYISNADLSKYAYWLLNGSKMLNMKVVTIKYVQSDADKNMKVYSLSPLYINRYNLSDVFYQCVIFNKDIMGKQIISKATKVVTLPGKIFLLANMNHHVFYMTFFICVSYFIETM